MSHICGRLDLFNSVSKKPQVNRQPIRKLIYAPLFISTEWPPFAWTMCRLTVMMKIDEPHCERGMPRLSYEIEPCFTQVLPEWQVLPKRSYCVVVWVEGPRVSETPFPSQYSPVLREERLYIIHARIVWFMLSLCNKNDITPPAGLLYYT